VDGVQWSVSRPGRFTPRKAPQYSLDFKLGVPQAGLDAVKTKVLPLPGTETSPAVQLNRVSIQGKNFCSSAEMLNIPARSVIFLQGSGFKTKE
jgi:hypothetical protein